MMAVDQPAWLLLLPLALLLPAWWLRRRAIAMLFPDTSLAVVINTSRGTRARWCGAVGRGLALAAAVIALAGPRWAKPGAVIPTQGIAILLVVDVSNSMNEEDFVWQDKPISRLAAMKQSLHLFVAGGDGPGGEHLTGRPHDLVGLVTFTRRPKSSCPLTLSHDALLAMLDSEETNKGGHDFDTNIGDAIVWGIDRLNASPVKQRVMILVTDGEQGEIPGALRPLRGAQLAGTLGIPIYALDAGHDAAPTDKTPADKLAIENRQRGKKTLQDVAKLTSGEYYGPNDGKELSAAFSRLSNELDQIERVEIETIRRRNYVEGYTWFAGAAFVLWFAVVGLELTVWRRFP